MKSSAFNGARLHLARAFTGFTQGKLAIEIGASRPLITQIETGAKPPSDVTLASMAHELGFDKMWFFQPLQFDFAAGDGHFRCSKNASIDTRHRMTSQSVLCDELAALIGTRLKLKKDAFPRINARTDDDIERAAERCRMQWGLGLDTPIRSIFRTIEHAGAIITTTTVDQEVDAFSRRLRFPIVVVNQKKNSASRNVFDIAHECGHLVLHEDASEYDEALEVQAHRFASALLMPRTGFFREFPRSTNVDLDALLRLKERWRVSVAAMVHRARDIGIISASQYSRAYREIAVRGWAKSEPAEFAADAPETLQTCLNVIQERHAMNWDDVARHLGWAIKTLQLVVPHIEPPAIDEVNDESRVIPIGVARIRPPSVVELTPPSLSLWDAAEQSACDESIG